VCDHFRGESTRKRLYRRDGAVAIRNSISRARGCANRPPFHRPPLAAIARTPCGAPVPIFALTAILPGLAGFPHGSRAKPGILQMVFVNLSRQRVGPGDTLTLRFDFLHSQRAKRLSDGPCIRACSNLRTGCRRLLRWWEWSQCHEPQIARAVAAWLCRRHTEVSLRELSGWPGV
jgi:hypothetical protein